MEETTEIIRNERQDEELIDVLTAISVVAKRLARNLRDIEKEGGPENGEDERCII
ncbi:MAG: hypothetical protein LUD72_11550 [Bacteroidales bacterium]|nr:hypothetical protein [Bacteroidales bacterium]